MCQGWLQINGTDHWDREQQRRSDVKRMNISLHLDMLILKHCWDFREDSSVSSWVDGAGAQMRGLVGNMFLSHLCIWSWKVWKIYHQERISRGLGFWFRVPKCLQRWPWALGTIVPRNYFWMWCSHIISSFWSTLSHYLLCILFNIKETIKMGTVFWNHQTECHSLKWSLRYTTTILCLSLQWFT